MKTTLARIETLLAHLLPLSGVGFLRVAMIPMLLPSRMCLLLRSSEVSGSQGNLQVQEEWGLLLQDHDGWPGLWDKAPHGQRRLIEGPVPVDDG